MQAIRDAIQLGAPLYNAGEIGACAAVYASLAEALAEDRAALLPLHRARLADALARAPAAEDARAWALRRALDSILLDEHFAPRLEAPLPLGFPAPARVAAVALRRLPALRAARVPSAGGGSAFGRLFQHISSRGIPMTAPVLASLAPGAAAAALDMAFLYPSPATGAPGGGGGGGVEVVDLPPATVLSVGVRGEASEGARRVARAAVEGELAARGLRAAGAWQALSYNSPMLGEALRYWELQVPVEEAAGAAAGAAPAGAAGEAGAGSSSSSSGSSSA
jgi:hypothetical protein